MLLIQARKAGRLAPGSSLLDVAMGGILDLVNRQPNLADPVIESTQIFLRQLCEVTGKDPDEILGSGSSRRS